MDKPIVSPLERKPFPVVTTSVKKPEPAEVKPLPIVAPYRTD